MRERYKHLLVFWTDLLYLMNSKPHALSSIGPLRSMASNAKKVASEIIDMNQELGNFNTYLAEYYKQMGDVWLEAQKKVDIRTTDLALDPEKFEAYKRIWIDIFDNDFTELFDSQKFGDNYGKMVSKELELLRHWNNIADVVLKTANLPNRHELDEVYRELHSLRRRVAILESHAKKRSKNGDRAV